MKLYVALISKDYSESSENYRFQNYSSFLSFSPLINNLLFLSVNFGWATEFSSAKRQSLLHVTRRPLVFVCLHILHRLSFQVIRKK